MVQTELRRSHKLAAAKSIHYTRFEGGDELPTNDAQQEMDPRSGDSTIQILNLSRVEPDPSLFTVPPDYSVVDEAGSFTIKVKGSSNAPPSNK